MDVITTNNLWKIYPNGVEAVKGIKLNIQKGTIFGFLGPNGAGKSTAIGMMTGILAPTRGELNVLGFSLPKQATEVAEVIGYVPQDFVFYGHLTVFENLKLMATAYDIPDAKQRVNEIMQLLEIDSLIKRRAENLSGGQKRRLNLALGMLNSPDILFLDEPSAGMDPQSRNILWNTIKTIANEDVTIILTTHLMETADRLADRVAIIDNGKIQVDNTPERLKQQYGSGNVVEIDLRDEITQKQLDSLYEDFSAIYEQKNVFRRNHTLKIATYENVDALIDVYKLVDTSIGKSMLQTISLHESTLEDVYLRVTGIELRE